MRLKRSVSTSFKRAGRRTRSTGRHPLRGLLAWMNGGFYHDGRFADLAAVIDHYDRHYVEPDGGRQA